MNDAASENRWVPHPASATGTAGYHFLGLPLVNHQFFGIIAEIDPVQPTDIMKQLRGVDDFFIPTGFGAAVNLSGISFDVFSIFVEKFD